MKGSDIRIKLLTLKHKAHQLNRNEENNDLQGNINDSKHSKDNKLEKHGTYVECAQHLTNSVRAKARHSMKVQTLDTPTTSPSKRLFRTAKKAKTAINASLQRPTTINRTFSGKLASSRTTKTKMRHSEQIRTCSKSATKTAKKSNPNNPLTPHNKRKDLRAASMLLNKTPLSPINTESNQILMPFGNVFTPSPTSKRL